MWPYKGSPWIGYRAAAIILLISVSLLTSAAPPSSWAATSNQTDLSQLPLSFPVQSPDVATYFNQIARPDDIASFPFQFVHLLPQITAGQKLVGFASWQEAEQELPNLFDQIDMVMYNPEHWENTPTDEQLDMEATIRRAADFVHGHGLQFVFAPDRQYAEEYLAKAAPYVDIAFLQGQRIQDDLQTFESWISNMIQTARSANPEIKIFVQVGATRGSAQQMYDAIQTVTNEIDGIAVWSMPRTLDILQEFVHMLREAPPTIATQQPTDSVTPTLTVIQTTQSPPKVETATFTPLLTTAVAERTEEATQSVDNTTVAPSIIPSLPPSQTPSLPVVPDSQAGGGWVSYLLIAGVSLVIGIFLGLWLARRSPRT